MNEDQRNIEKILITGLSDILKRTLELDPGGQLAIAQEYREWINCISANDFSKQEILVINRFTFK